MTIFFNFWTTSNHLHPLQVENCDSDSRPLVDEDDNGKFKFKGLTKCDDWKFWEGYPCQMSIPRAGLDIVSNWIVVNPICTLIWCIYATTGLNSFKPEFTIVIFIHYLLSQFSTCSGCRWLEVGGRFTIVIFIHYKPRIAVAIPDS